MDRGINWIDTAAVYGFGHSEEVVGRAVTGRRDKVLVATKCGRVPSRDGVNVHRLAAASVRAELEASLRRLSTDYIDLYQVHWPDPEPEIEEAWGEIAKAVKEGKVRFAGVSNFNTAQMKRLQGILPITSLQPPYSMLRREAETELFPFCKANGIGVVCYSPMQMGLLTGTFNKARVSQLPGKRSALPQQFLHGAVPDTEPRPGGRAAADRREEQQEHGRAGHRVGPAKARGDGGDRRRTPPATGGRRGGSGGLGAFPRGHRRDRHSPRRARGPGLTRRTNENKVEVPASHCDGCPGGGLLRRGAGQRNAAGARGDGRVPRS